MKVCPKCGRTLGVDAYAWRNRAKGTRQTTCRDCFKAYNRQRYLAKRDQLLEQCRAYHAANREAISERHRRWYTRNLDVNRERNRANARVQNARPERKDAKREWARRDRALNPEKWRAKSRRDYARNPFAKRHLQAQRRVAKLKSPIGHVAVADLQGRWDVFGGCCWMCGEEASEWDHVKPLTRGGSHCLANLRPACRSCNASKGANWPLTTERSRHGGRQPVENQDR